MQLTVARIGRAHGLRGEVALDLRTDSPEERLAVGQVLATEPAAAGPLTVAGTRSQHGRWFASFAEARDRTAAEALQGVELVVDADADDDEDAWYPHELAGLRAELADGTVVGRIDGLEHLPAHDVLVLVEAGSGARTLVPFVRAIVPVVDVPGGRVVLDPPGGLLASDVENLVVSPETGGADVSDDPDGDEHGGGPASAGGRD
ncbi:ribosome maturation factor RimM [uncultured Cellulomonas sp.]|uniref:ribosome maturation factor RimM n=1 Tax=uncultured Cellulomonas sp. TaxID=189682 RepID=UPI002613A3A9|nr:ribosome maturation factor RimM [uncultured Cellulomonas sp.]